MTTLSRSLARGARPLVAYLRDAWAELATAFRNLFDMQQDADTAQATDPVTRAAGYDSQVLRHAAFANSSNEVEWLLYAAMMTDAAKKRYCLERALAINPGSELAHRALARLDRHDDA